ncbi:TPA: hypothetical protein N0F65_011352 [Lagenidium giganteum]|uniref:Transposase n=1 Tax=Lagenidium giganteum TaxID=4803 RepID=A0AAV2Z5E7_9STRA|nr:TPA: hypothetical protein N0F65_011352 [Lagenidium giganteum]
MTNFSAREFDGLWQTMKPKILSTWNIEKGRECAYSGKNVLFMMLATMKNGGTWASSTMLFRNPKSSFVRMVTDFIPQNSRRHVRRICEHRGGPHNDFKTPSGRPMLRQLPALYAVDATFQQTNRPQGNRHGAMTFFSGKHH